MYVSMNLQNALQYMILIRLLLRYLKLRSFSASGRLIHLHHVRGSDFRTTGAKPFRVPQLLAHYSPPPEHHI